MSEDEQKITLPNQDDLERLAEQRTLIAEMLTDEEDRATFATPPGKLAFLNAILEQKIFAPTDTYELQCMGVVLGDVFVAASLGLEWVTVEDSYGRDPALCIPETSILIYPLTMISKRVERGEDFDVCDLFGGVCEQIEKMKAEGF